MRFSLKPICLINNKSAGLLVVVSIVATAGLYAPILNAAPIYKVVDEKTGQITFTDRPQSYEQEAGKQVSQTNITTGNETSRSNDSANDDTQTNVTATADSSTKDGSEESRQVNYQLTMIEPSTERAYHRPAQSIDVKIQLEPALQAGDKVSIYFDGNEVAQGLSASIATVDMLPGQYSIQAVVTDKKGQTLQQIERTVFVIQNTAMLRNKKKIAQQLQAYQNLPWHQKVLLKLRQSDIAKP